MAERIICFICGVFCAAPFWAISLLKKNSNEPINFWSGDISLKEKIKDVPKYNAEMAALYRNFGLVLFAAAFVALIFPIAGIVLLCLTCSLGIYFLYKSYKKILGKYS